jgi:hypothetical protein
MSNHIKRYDPKRKRNSRHLQIIDLTELRKSGDGIYDQHQPEIKRDAGIEIVSGILPLEQWSDCGAW